MNNIENSVNAGDETVVQSQDVSAENAAPEEVVDPQNSNGNDTVEGAEGNSADDVASHHQSRNENAKFADLRRAKESAERQLAEAQQRTDSLFNSLRGLGYTGDTISEIEDEINAQNAGVPVEEYRKTAAERKAEIDKAVNSDPRVLAAAEFAKKQQFAEDLSKVKAAYPDVKAEKIEELGEVFMRGMAAGLTPEDAYAAQLAHNTRLDAEKKPEPPKIGSVKQAYNAEAEYFSPEELERLNTTDAKLLDDPKVLEKALKSMKYLK